MKAYVWYRLAIAAGHLDAQFPGRAAQPADLDHAGFFLAMNQGIGEATQLAFARKSDDGTLPALMTTEERAAFAKLRQRKDAAPGSVEEAKAQAEKDMPAVWAYVYAYAIGRDPFLSRHGELAKAALLTAKGQAQFEAARWLTAAWQRGSVDAALLLARMHLAEDSLTGESGWNINVPWQPPASGEAFRSAAEAARLYREAIDKGSFAARSICVARDRHGAARTWRWPASFTGRPSARASTVRPSRIAAPRARDAVAGRGGAGLNRPRRRSSPNRPMTRHRLSSGERGHHLRPGHRQARPADVQRCPGAGQEVRVPAGRDDLCCRSAMAMPTSLLA